MHLKWPSDSCFHITSQWFDRLFHFCKKSRHIESWHRALVWKEREKCKSIRETHEQVIILIATWKIQIQKQSENDHCDEKEMAKLQRAQQKAMYFIWSHRVSLDNLAKGVRIPGNLTLKVSRIWLQNFHRNGEKQTLGGHKQNLCAHQWPHRRLSQTWLWVFEGLLWRRGLAVAYHIYRGTGSINPWRWVLG